MASPTARAPSSTGSEPPAPRSEVVTAPLPDYDASQYQLMITQNYTVHPDWTWAQRCYEPYFYIHKSAEGEDLHNDMLILQARNSLCTMALSPLHSLFTHLHANPTLTLVSVAFTETAKSNVASRPKEGKSKKARHEARKRRKVGGHMHGAESGQFQFFPHAVIAHATTSDNSVFDICAGINGDLVHLNVGLEAHPEWLVTSPMSLGHVAVVYPRVPALKLPHQVPLEEYRKMRPEFGEDKWPTLVGPKEAAEDGEEEQGGKSMGGHVATSQADGESGQGIDGDEDASGGEEEDE